MKKNSYKKIITIAATILIMTGATMSEARYAGDRGYRGGDGYRGGYRDNRNVTVNRYDNNARTGGYSWNGRRYNYYHNGQYYNYYHNGNYYRYYWNGAYYNNCNVVAGYWLNGIWIAPSQQCW